jgi:hypothetical protein
MVYEKGTLPWAEFWILTAGKNIKRKLLEIWRILCVINNKGVKNENWGRETNTKVYP